MAKRVDDPFEYPPKAIHHMELSIKRLRWAKNPAHQHIHDNLVRCRDEEDYNCGSLGCRLCREWGQRTFSQSVWKRWRRKHQLYFYTLIPVDGWVAYDQIDTFDLLAFVRRHREKLKRVLPKGMRIAGGVDFSLDIFENGERWWQVHLHFLTDQPIDKKTEDRLKLRYPPDRSKAIFAPFDRKVIPSADVLTNSAYSLKSYFLKRSGFIADPEKGGRGGRRHGGGTLMPDADELLQLAFSKYRVTDALFLIGLKRMRSSNPAIIKLRRA